MNLRDYQTRAMHGTLEAFYGHNKRSTLVVMPTGTGKTVTFAHIIKMCEIKNGGKRTMVVAHREELISQAAEKIHRVTGHLCDVEMADRRADTNNFWTAPVVVASVQTLNSGNRLAKFIPSDFGLLVIDEAHHAVAESYKKIISHFAQSKVLGVTATPDRTDELAMGQVFETVAMNYEIENAIGDGYLVPLVQHQIHVNGLDFSGMRTTAGDLNGADLARVMEAEAMIHKIADPLIREAGPLKTLLFTASVKQADDMAMVLNRYRANCARAINGMTPKPERAAVLEMFRRGEIQFLANCGVFTEGFDDPTIELVALARPTKSRSLYSQMVGRGFRPLPELVDGVESAVQRRENIANSNKPLLTVVDFVGNAGKHKLMTTMDILGGKHSDEARKRALKIAAAAQRSGKTVTVTDALLSAEEELKREAARESAKLVQLANTRKVRATATYTKKSVDPFSVFGMERVPKVASDRSPPSEKMIQMLTNWGVPNAAGLEFGEAGQLINTINSRFQKGLCTFKQAAILKKRGLNPDMTREQASVAIDEIRSRENWKSMVGGVRK